MIKGAVTLAIVAILSSTARGQDAAPPKVDLESPADAAVATPSATPDIPDLSQIDAVFKETSLGRQADERRLHIQWRQVANQVANDPDVIAAKSAVKGARTDLEKRQRLRDYYGHYYGRMQALAGDGQLKTALETIKVSHIARTRQPRVRPLTDSTPTPTPSNDGSLLTPTPTPTASPGHKHKKKGHWYQ